MNREKQLKLFKNFIVNCTTNTNSLKNYIDFKRINECLQQLFPETKDVSILDFDDAKTFEQVINRLDQLESYIDYNAKGKNQYSTTVGWYQRFLNAKNIFSKQDEIISSVKNTTDHPLQQIFYGAPGTGKSHTIKVVTEVQPKENVFRTTFHPDSDYSTFVGCYKPAKENSVSQTKSILDYDSLVNKFKEYLDVKNPYQNITRACTLFGYDYHDSIVRMQEGNTHTIPELVADAYKSGTTYDSQVRAGMACYEDSIKPQNTSSGITYAFIPQSFTKAYLRAWQTTDPIYLIIEEINRGNCAQIFGDLFQLLDRGDNGQSEYPIKADNDLATYIGEQLSNTSREGLPENVKSGEDLMLPSNLYIWATMNTSDQSLFPIDSAFKRRWEWKYVPINNHEDKNYKIEIDTAKYDWWGFLSKINQVIGDTTSSEDKKLGYFFAKAKGNIIDAEQFVGKVLFYLWNDVFKNYGFNNPIFSKGDNKKFEFAEFFKQDGSPDSDMVNKFLVKLDETIDKENSFVETNNTSNNDGQGEQTDTLLG